MFVSGNFKSTLVQLLDKEYQFLAKEIKAKFFKPRLRFETTIFICGADKNDTSKNRFKISELLQDSWRKRWIEFIYPENIFEELLYSSESKDLLSLEGLLARTVDIILMIPESPGSFAELGAFANDENLRKKMVCILDTKYKKDKSFINQGPIKLVRKANKENVIFIDFKDLENEIEKIHRAISKYRKSSTFEKEVNLLQADNFLLPVIFLLEPVDKRSLSKIVEFALEDGENGFQITQAALTSMNRKNLIEQTPDGYKLSLIGKQEFFKYKERYTRFKSVGERDFIDNIRLELLNLKNRNRRMKVV